jgi:hypothetical protein
VDTAPAAATESGIAAAIETSAITKARRAAPTAAAKAAMEAAAAKATAMEATTTEPTGVEAAAAEPPAMKPTTAKASTERRGAVSADRQAHRHCCTRQKRTEQLLPV